MAPQPAVTSVGRPNCTGVQLRCGPPRTIRRAQLNDCGIYLLEAAADDSVRITLVVRHGSRLLACPVSPSGVVDAGRRRVRRQLHRLPRLENPGYGRTNGTADSQEHHRHRPAPAPRRCNDRAVHATERPAYQTTPTYRLSTDRSGCRPRCPHPRCGSGQHAIGNKCPRAVEPSGHLLSSTSRELPSSCSPAQHTDTHRHLPLVVR